MVSTEIVPMIDKPIKGKSGFADELLGLSKKIKTKSGALDELY